MRVSGHQKPPRQVNRPGNAHARRRDDLRNLPAVKRERRVPAQVAPVVCASHPQRLGELARTRTEVARRRPVAGRLHLRDAIQRLQSPDQDKPPPPSPHQHVQHPVHAIVEIHIGCSFRVTAYERARAGPEPGVTCRVVFRIIGLRLHDPPAARAPLQTASEQLPGTGDRVRPKKRPFHVRHGGNGSEDRRLVGGIPLHFPTPAFRATRTASKMPPGTQRRRVKPPPPC